MTVGSEGRDVFSGSVGGRGSAPPPPVEGSSQPGGVHFTPAPRVGSGGWGWRWGQGAWRVWGVSGAGALGRAMCHVHVWTVAPDCWPSEAGAAVLATQP